jgi:hypothetical protein
MDAIYYFVIDNGPTLAPVVLAACWYGLVMQVISTDDDICCPETA